MAQTDLITLDQVERALIDGEAIETVPAEEVTADIVRRILGAETLAEAAQDFTATPAENIEGIIVEVRSVAFMQSAFTEGAPVYALMRCVPDGSSKELVVSIGGRSVMAMLLWALKHGEFPFAGTFRKRQSKTPDGNAYWTFSLAYEPGNK